MKQQYISSNSSVGSSHNGTVSLSTVSARRQAAATALRLKLLARSKNVHQLKLQKEGFANTITDDTAYTYRRNDRIRNTGSYIDRGDDALSIVSNTSNPHDDADVYADTHAFDPYGTMRECNARINTFTNYNGSWHQQQQQQDGHYADYSQEDQFQEQYGEYDTNNHTYSNNHTYTNSQPLDTSNSSDAAADADNQFIGRKLHKRKVKEYDTDDDDDEEDVKPYRSFMLDAATKVKSALKTVKSFVKMPEISSNDGNLKLASLQDIHAVDNRSIQRSMHSLTNAVKKHTASVSDSLMIKLNYLNKKNDKSRTSGSRADSANNGNVSNSILLVSKVELDNSYALPPPKHSLVGMKPVEKYVSPAAKMVQQTEEPYIVQRLDVMLNHMLLGKPKSMKPPDPTPWRPPERHEVLGHEHYVQKLPTNNDAYEGSHSVEEYQKILKAATELTMNHQLSATTSSTVTATAAAIETTETNAQEHGMIELPMFTSSYESMEYSSPVVSEHSTLSHSSVDKFLTKSLVKAASMIVLPSLAFSTRRNYDEARKVRLLTRNSHKAAATTVNTSTTANAPTLTSTGNNSSSGSSSSSIANSHMKGGSSRHLKALADLEAGKTPIVYAISSNQRPALLHDDVSVLSGDVKDTVKSDTYNSTSRHHLTLKDATKSIVKTTSWYNSHAPTNASAVDTFYHHSKNQHDHNKSMSYIDNAATAMEPVSASSACILQQYYTSNPNTLKARTDTARSQLYNKLHKRYGSDPSGLHIKKMQEIEYKQQLSQQHDEVFNEYNQELEAWADRTDSTTYRHRAVQDQKRSTGNDTVTTPAAGWHEFWDESAQAIYYYNYTTGEATWTKPSFNASYVDTAYYK